MQSKDETNTDILEEVKKKKKERERGTNVVSVTEVCHLEITISWTSRNFIKKECYSRCTTRK